MYLTKKTATPLKTKPTLKNQGWEKNCYEKEN